MKCEYHVCQKDAGTRRYCTRSCNTKHRIHKKRKEFKARAVAYLGGKCQRCGYAKSSNALHFHHLRDKDGVLSAMIRDWKSWEVIQAELDKCELLCANCHAEEHTVG